MEEKIIRNDLERLEIEQARLTNGEMMDFYSLNEDVLLYGISLEGDEYIRGPLFYSPGDAILHSLNKAYLHDTVGYATPEYPVNSSSSSLFHFNSSVRLREYKLDGDLYFYDARGKIRPDCSEVGVTNFKTDYYMRLPWGNQRLINIRSSNNLSKEDIDSILANIVSEKTSYSSIKLEAFYICEPGEILSIAKILNIDSDVLWTFYTSLRKAGYLPEDIRKEAFLGQKSGKVLAGILKNIHMLSADNTIPGRIINDISDGKSLRELNSICTRDGLNNIACMSGLFFELLWKRDAESISKYFNRSMFNASDNQFLYPFPFRNMKLDTTILTSFNPYVKSWFYLEDIQTEMGKNGLEYNWNYNRFLDLNTVIYWILYNLSKSPEKEPYLRTTKLAHIQATSVYDPIYHMSVIPHRFTNNVISNFNRIEIYDSALETSISMSFDPTFENPALSVSRGLYIRVTNLNDGVESDRGRGIKKNILKILTKLIKEYDYILRLSTAYQDSMGDVDPDLLILEVNPNNETIQGIPSNWLIMLYISSVIRYLIRTKEFSFFTFV